MKKSSITVKNVGKCYKLYGRQVDRLTELFSSKKKKLYKEFHALNDISFEVEKGECFGLIGTNGAGKSTLLKLITGVATPTSGSIDVDGNVSALLELGAGFNHDYTGIENIYLNGFSLGFSRKEMQSRVDDIIEFADIGEYIHQPVKQYSSGMFARLAFAVAINVNPDILIVDEALSVGDAFFQNKCYRKFNELKERGVTILFVSHDISTVKRMCDHVLWIENGTMKMIGESNTVCNAYLNTILEQKSEYYQKENNSEESAAEQSEKQEVKKSRTNVRRLNYSIESILSDKIEIIDVVLKDKNDSLVAICEINEPYILEVEFESQIDMDSCIVGYSVENSKGVLLMNCNSMINGEQKPLIIQKNSKNIARFEFIMPAIEAGTYLIGVAISQGTIESYEVLTWLYNVFCFSLNNESKSSALLDIENKITCTIKG